MNRTPFLIEVCVSRVADAMLAVSAGADRIELNAALELDGLTPSIGLCLETRSAIQVPIIAMLRPHHSGFVYDQSDRQVILRDAERLLDSGIDGIAFGALDESGQLDLELTRQVRRLSEGRELVFHRAFDDLANQLESLEYLIDIGVDRILTSGGVSSAEAGIPRIEQLYQAASKKIEILPAGGVTHRNIYRILTETGCTQVHGSFKLPNECPISPDAKSIAMAKHLANKVWP